MLWNVFQTETIKFIYLRGESIEEKKLLEKIYVCSILLIIFGGFFLFYQHWEVRPNVLLKRFPQYKSLGFFTQYKLPYIYYFPYSFINNILLFVPLVGVSSYGLFRRILKIKNLKRDIILRTRKISSSRQQRQDKYELIMKGVDYFNSEYLEILGDYSKVLFCLTLVIAFEYLVGKITLSEPGKILAYICFTLAISIPLIVFFEILNYGYFLQKNEKYLKKICTTSQLHEFQTNQTSFKLFLKAIERFSVIPISFFILCNIPPLNIIKRFWDLIK